jgi:hypothetical protein
MLSAKVRIFYQCAGPGCDIWRIQMKDDEDALKIVIIILLIIILLIMMIHLALFMVRHYL